MDDVASGISSGGSTGRASSALSLSCGLCAQGEMSFKCIYFNRVVRACAPPSGRNHTFTILCLSLFLDANLAKEVALESPQFK